MSNQNPPSQSTGSWFKKRSYARITPSKNNDNNGDIFFPKNKKTKLDQQAYYNVVNAESCETSNSLFLNKIPMTSDVIWSREKLLKFQERLNIAPAKMPKKPDKAEPQPDNMIEDSHTLSWGQVSPASLVGRWISIRMSGEEDYADYLIKDYDAKTEAHHVVTALSRKDLDDPCNWIDLRYIPTEDIVWKEGHPGFPARKSYLKPGETILHATSTARQKKQLKEYGKTANGIPIIRNLRDKGKGIA